MVKRKTLLLLGGGLVLAGGLSLLVYRKFILGFPLNIIGRKITKAPADAGGWVLIPPGALAGQVGVSVDTYSLTRVIGSEYADGNFIEKLGIGWVIVNEARRRGTSLTKLATKTSKFGDKGLYGSQEHGRFASTARDPTDEDLYVARGILAGAFSDPTGGAVNFFSPSAQRQLAVSKPHLYDPPEVFFSNRKKEGKVPIAIAGVNPDKLVFFRYSV